MPVHNAYTHRITLKSTRPKQRIQTVGRHTPSTKTATSTPTSTSDARLACENRTRDCCRDLRSFCWLSLVIPCLQTSEQRWAKGGRCARTRIQTKRAKFGRESGCHHRGRFTPPPPPHKHAWPIEESFHVAKLLHYCCSGIFLVLIIVQFFFPFWALFLPCDHASL